MSERTPERPTPEDLDVFRSKVRAWLAENKPPAPDFPLPDSFMEVGTPEQFAYLQAWQRKVYDAGYLGLAWPKEYGGGGKHPQYQAVVNREMGAANVPFMVNIIGLMWAGPVILQMGSHAQKARYIPKILSGEEIWCQGFSEPGHGSDLGSAQTTAVRDGDEWVLNGTKIWTSLGTEAKHMILLARTDPGAPTKYKGLTFFLAPVDIPGVEKRPIKKITGEYGFNETRFEDARIPADCILGREGEGWAVAMATLMFERGAAEGQAGGLSMVPLRVADVVQLAREQLRDGRPAIEDPIIGDQLVRFIAEERAMGLCQLRARIPALSAERPHAILMMNKLVVSEFRRRLTRFAISLQGARAALYMGDPDAPDGGHWQRNYMNAFSATIGGGTSQIQKNILGERVLGLAKSY
ncbi:MAG: acyl-CoA dehydrogenase family protein [Myxococcales bacterium]|nr:acyl-CoA dehydrogenase family protein [Myxococcales bacterium]